MLDEVDAGSTDRRILVGQGSAYLPNVFCVAGAFFLGFSSLTTVLITNLGTVTALMPAPPAGHPRVSSGSSPGRAGRPGAADRQDDFAPRRQN